MAVIACFATNGIDTKTVQKTTMAKTNLGKINDRSRLRILLTSIEFTAAACHSDQQQDGQSTRLKEIQKRLLLLLTLPRYLLNCRFGCEGNTLG